MRPEGWCFLIGFWGLIVAVAAFCFRRVFEKKEVK